MFECERSIKDKIDVLYEEIGVLIITQKPDVEQYTGNKCRFPLYAVGYILYCRGRYIVDHDGSHNQEYIVHMGIPVKNKRSSYKEKVLGTARYKS